MCKNGKISMIYRIKAVNDFMFSENYREIQVIKKTDYKGQILGVDGYEKNYKPVSFSDFADKLNGRIRLFGIC